MNRTRKGWWWIWPRQILYIIRVLETWSLVVSGSLFSTYTGWWYTYPSEKYKSQLGWLFPIYGKSWKFMFQTTNQYTSNIYIYINVVFEAVSSPQMPWWALQKSSESTSSGGHRRWIEQNVSECLKTRRLEPTQARAGRFTGRCQSFHGANMCQQFLRSVAPQFGVSKVV